MKKIKKRSIHPYILIISTYLSVIIIGLILLVMPFAMKNMQSMGFTNALFMSTSAVCVTGLSVMENGLGADLSIYGKIVMCLLMEIGGLSIITIGVFFFTIVGAKIGIGAGFLIKESLNQNTMKDLLTLVKNIMLISFTIQLICALINIYPFYEYFKYYNEESFAKAFFTSIFHSVASFNNAGFDIIHGSKSFVEFSMDSTVLSTSSKIIFNLTTMFMIYAGGIGFVVINDVLAKRRWRKFSLHTKITLITTLILIVLGAVIIKFSANVNFMDAFFTSFTARTAGFQTFEMATLEDKPVSFVIINILMFIGASPCSTGGGIKTTTIAIIFIAIFNFARGKKNNVFERRLDSTQILKAFVLVNLAIMIIILATLALLISQSELRIDRILFEVVSAFSTTGLSMGITTSLNIFSKYVIIILMILGRLGILTIVGVLNKNWLNQPKDNIEYIEESVYIG